MSLNDTTNTIPYGYCQCGCGGLAPIAERNRAAYGHVKGRPMACIKGHTHQPAVSRFWSKVDKRTPEGCWEWTGYRVASGYGRISINNKQVRAHRFSYELHFGSIPDGMIVLHICDNPACVNPSHLRLGTNAENSADMTGKGRQAKGKKASKARLTESQVLDIRQRYARGVVTLKTLANQYGVSITAISAVVRRKSWAHLKD